ncbi:PadR family transcriptional regulator [Bacillus halotolerans]|uniref:PadR family transcriptional regulator n=1 Tax=Bacillus halotolerans TaxID=260554 RepID=UPI0020C38989|nr:PadR family transcriptional regulator [Bacillus halotolerans]UTL73790.1 PadR family transcriptional regulator [Bacillus halotolerans]
MKTNQINDRWIVQFRKGIFDLAILSLLRSKPMYGYELTSSLKTTPALAISEGAIYPILKRMTEKDWVEFFWQDSLDGPKRKYYKMTQKGEEMLKERLEKYLETHQALLSLSGDLL